jgi:glycosyltransferase involved in cell wall biosynthesis
MNVVWLASWYPNRTSISNGDFIERHARAVAPHVQQLSVISVVKDDALPAGIVQLEEYRDGNLLVLQAYYGAKSGGVVRKIFSQQKYRQLQWQLYQQVVEKYGVPMLVHVHVALRAGLFAVWLKKKWGVPYVLSEHWSGYFKESQPNIYQMGWLYQQLVKRVLQHASLLLPVTRHLGQTIVDAFEQVPYHTVPNVVDTHLFTYQLAKADAFTFIHPSYMNYSKNPEGILQACALLKEKGYNFKLLMIGNRPPALIQLATDMKLINTVVFFEDAQPYRTVAQRMQQANALLLFSRYESLPCVVLEALCCGLPVISSRVGGIPDVIDHTNGILIDKYAINELTDAMAQVINNYQYYNRPQIAAAAKARFSYPIVGAAIAAIYKEQAAAAHRPASN